MGSQVYHRREKGTITGLASNDKGSTAEFVMVDGNLWPVRNRVTLSRVQWRYFLLFEL